MKHLPWECSFIFGLLLIPPSLSQSRFLIYLHCFLPDIFWGLFRFRLRVSLKQNPSFSRWNPSLLNGTSGPTSQFFFFQIRNRQVFSVQDQAAAWSVSHPKSVFWRPNPCYLRMWPCLETGSLQMWLVKMRVYARSMDPYSDVLSVLIRENVTWRHTGRRWLYDLMAMETEIGVTQIQVQDKDRW